MCTCFFKWPDCLKDLLHTSHENGRSPLCVRKCTFNANCDLKDLLHTSHEKGRSSLCTMRKCTFNADCELRDLLHTSQEKRRFPLWACSCNFKVCWCLKDFLQISHENWRSLPWLHGVSRGLPRFKDVLHTSLDSRRCPEWMFGCFFKVSCCLRAVLGTSHETAPLSHLSDRTKLFSGSAICPFCCLTITWASSSTETVWKTKWTTAVNNIHWFAVWNVFMYSSGAWDGRKWCVKKSAVYNGMTDVNKHIYMCRIMWTQCSSLAQVALQRTYSCISWRSSFSSPYHTLHVFPMFHRNTVPHVRTETLWMCCGAKWHSFSRATEGSYTSPTLMGKNSDEFNAAVKTECSYNYTNSYSFVT